jgi:flavin reductase (DIM6/NTAB) family NADH-FMN oxidoreductase RutF
MKKTIDPRPWFFPRPVLLLSARDRLGKDNIVTVTWAGIACTTPPMVTVSLRKTRHSHSILSETKEFVLNLPTSKQMDLVEVCGTVSGRDTDKFATLGLAKAHATVVQAPLIAECPINLECRIHHVLPLGSHDLFVAEIVQTHVNHALLLDDGRLDDVALDCLAWGSEEFMRVLRPKHRSRHPLP